MRMTAFFTRLARKGMAAAVVACGLAACSTLDQSGDSMVAGVTHGEEGPLPTTPVFVDRTSTASVAATRPNQPSRQYLTDYRISPKDVLQVTVFQVPDLSASPTV